MKNNRQLTTNNQQQENKDGFQLPAISCRLRRGQTMLIAIMIVAAISIAIGVSVATTTSLIVSQSVFNKDALVAKTLAESCLEDNLMKMARGDFTPTSFTTVEGSCTIEISGNSPYVLNAVATVGRSIRKMRATVSVDSEVLNIQSWEETY